MKKLLLLGSVLATFLANATEWEKIPTKNANILKDVYMANPKEIIVVGDSGRVLKTIDGGQTWNALNVKSTKNQWEAIHFVNDTIGYLGGQSENIYQTTDGGKTWKSVYTIQGSSSQIFDIDFLDAMNGVAVGRSGEVVVTTDGGKTWKDNLSSSNKYNGVSFVNKDFIYAVASNQVASSVNAGQTWSLQTSDNILEVAFVNDTLGFRVGALGLCEQTIDGGQNWKKIDLQVTVALYDVDFDGMRGYIVGTEGVVFETMDGGKTWMKIDIGTQDGLYAVSFDKMHNAVIVGAKGGIYVTKTPKKEWMNTSLSEMKILKDVSVINDSVAFIVGQTGLVKKTVDGGKTWTDVIVKTTNNQWEAVYFVNDMVGYLGGQFEDIYQTTDGGKTWKSVYTIQGSSSQIFDINFLDAMNGVAVGRSGEVVVTTDGGKTWKDNLSSSNKYNGVSFVNKDFIYAVASNQVASSVNAGQTWALQSSDNILEVAFVNDTLGFRVGALGLCEQTIDGGQNWKKIDLQVTVALYDVDFDGMRGYIVGTEGVVFETMDGGKTWMKIDVGTTKGLYAIDLKGKTGYIVGQDGTILTLGTKTGVITSVETTNNITESVVIYPNPVIGVLTISKEVSSIQVYNQIGELVANDENVSSINLSSLSSGIYVIHLMSKQGTLSVQKIVK